MNGCIEVRRDEKKRPKKKEKERMMERRTFNIVSRLYLGRLEPHVSDISNLRSTFIIAVVTEQVALNHIFIQDDKNPPHSLSSTDLHEGMAHRGLD